MKRYAALISYIGTRFCGWQIQGPASGDKNTVQEICEDTLGRITGTRVHWQSSGRTDSGVHAIGQVAHFTIDWDAPNRVGKETLAPFQLIRALNTLLPPDIRILSVKEVEPKFHSQRDAIKKQYSYYYQTGHSPTAAHHGRTAFYYGALDVPAMHTAIQALIGEHDFLPFQGAGAKPLRSTVRTIFEADVTDMRPEGPFPLPTDLIRIVRIRVVGTGFLKHMVRGIAGTLYQIGTGKRPSSDMAQILATQERRKVGSTAPAQGLWLERVWYPNLSFDA